MTNQVKDSITITESLPVTQTVLTPEAQAFLVKLHQNFNHKRKELLVKREERQKRLDKGEVPTFLEKTKSVREGDWKVAKTPHDLEKRWVEITGPTDKKMVINALNSGADVFMADFEDANSPTFKNMLEGQSNLSEAIEGSLNFKNPEGKEYRLNDKRAVLMVRPRGWHLEEKHFLINGEPMSGSLFDFGLYFFRNAQKLINKKSGPYFYLPKMESHEEARLWNDVFNFAQDELKIPRGTIRATVLLETILAAFEMEEILYELKDHSAGLNAGRWDYIFSVIKKFHAKKSLLLPNREQITMTVPFMRAYTELLVKSCHKRGAHAMGGMAAFIPSRKDKEVNELALKKVREDKLRESQDGFDGTWVAHPDLVSVARTIFEEALKGKDNQKERLREDVSVKAENLQDFLLPGSKITEEGIRASISVTLQYLEAWLSGQGAVGINNLMEDAATAEISRTQLWHWVHQERAVTAEGKSIDESYYKQLAREEFNKLKSTPNLQKAKEILDELVLSENLHPFLTLIAYEYLDQSAKN
jgi:malate synthase